MKFISKTEAYTYALYMLIYLKKNGKYDKNKVVQIDATINQIKTAIENHEQNPKIVAGYLTNLAKNHLNNEVNLLNLAKDINQNDYNQLAKEKFENALGRRFESEIPIKLLTNPTKKMMEAVGRLSKELLSVIDFLKNTNKLNTTLNWSFLATSHPIALGAPSEPYSETSIRDVLTNNKPEQFIEIMYIHFKFARDVTRLTPINHAPKRKPTGKLLEIIQGLHLQGEEERFFSEKIKKLTGVGKKYRSYIANRIFSKSSLYTAYNGRGRKGTIKKQYTNQMGLLLNHQSSYAHRLPIHSSRWIADCKSQEADMESPYVIDLIENDAIYVAGPSGMTGLFLGQMEFLGNFENETLKKNYLSAVVSYIVGGGFHSLHEVIGPAQYALNLVPGYEVRPPEAKVKAPPPNFHQFFEQQSAIDEQFADRYNNAWDCYMDFFRKNYLPSHNYLDVLSFNISSKLNKGTVKFWQPRGETLSEKQEEKIEDLCK